LEEENDWLCCLMMVVCCFGMFYEKLCDNTDNIKELISSDDV